MTRAEQAAVEKYPHGTFDGELGDSLRAACAVGYHKAEKETIDRVCKWLEENATYVHPRKGIKTCIINLNVLREAMEEEQ